MTITDNPTVAFDEEGFEIEPGTLCWVRPDSTTPTAMRNSRCLAVFCGSHGSQPWLLLIPDNDRDPWVTASERGWRFRAHMTEDQMDRLDLGRFAETHRGWWVGRASIQFIETAAGHWCVEHQVFHAAETCPPTEYADIIARLEKELTEAKQQAVIAREEGEAALEAFKVRASDILAEAANEHDLCGAYDTVCESAGLYPRESDHEIEIEVTYRQTVTVRARRWETAVQEVRAKSATAYFAPPTVFADASNIEDEGSPYSLSFTIAD
jgi:hypothetical protein